MNLLKNYNLSLVLLVLFLVSWAGQTWTGWVEFESEQRQHEQLAQVWSDDGYVWHWAQATLENWQSEFLQLFTMVVLTAFLIHKGSAESRDSNDRMEESLKRIEKRLERLDRGKS